MNCTPKIEHNFGSAVFLSKLYLFNKMGTNYNRRLVFYVNMFQHRHRFVLGVKIVLQIIELRSNKIMDKFWEDILLGIENTTEAEWDKLFSDFEKDGYINEVLKQND